MSSPYSNLYPDDPNQPTPATRSRSAGRSVRASLGVFDQTMSVLLGVIAATLIAAVAILAVFVGALMVSVIWGVLGWPTNSWGWVAPVVAGFATATTTTSGALRPSGGRASAVVAAISAILGVALPATIGLAATSRLPHTPNNQWWAPVLNIADALFGNTLQPAFIIPAILGAAWIAVRAWRDATAHLDYL